MRQSDVVADIATRLMGWVQRYFDAPEFKLYRSLVDTGVTTMLSGFLFMYSRQVQKGEAEPLAPELRKLLTDRRRRPLERVFALLTHLVSRYEAYTSPDDRAAIDTELRAIYDVLDRYFRRSA